MRYLHTRPQHVPGRVPAERPVERSVETEHAAVSAEERRTEGERSVCEAALAAESGPFVVVYVCATASIRLRVPWNVPHADRSLISSFHLVQSSGRNHPAATARKHARSRLKPRCMRSMLV
jgi:hypothetical protein